MCGICPFNKDIFDDYEFLAPYAIDRTDSTEMPNNADQSITNFQPQPGCLNEPNQFSITSSICEKSCQFK